MIDFRHFLFRRCPTGGSHTSVRTIRCAYTPGRCSPSSCWRTAMKAFYRARNFTFSRRPRRASVTRASHRRRLARGTGTKIFSSFPPTKLNGINNFMKTKKKCDGITKTANRMRHLIYILYKYIFIIIIIRASVFSFSRLLRFLSSIILVCYNSIDFIVTHST